MADLSDADLARVRQEMRAMERKAEELRRTRPDYPDSPERLAELDEIMRVLGPEQERVIWGDASADWSGGSVGSGGHRT